MRPCGEGSGREDGYESNHRIAQTTNFDAFFQGESHQGSPSVLKLDRSSQPSNPITLHQLSIRLDADRTISAITEPPLRAFTVFDMADAVAIRSTEPTSSNHKLSKPANENIADTNRIGQQQHVIANEKLESTTKVLIGPQRPVAANDNLETTNQVSVGLLRPVLANQNLESKTQVLIGPHIQAATNEDPKSPNQFLIGPQLPNDLYSFPELNTESTQGRH